MTAEDEETQPHPAPRPKLRERIVPPDDQMAGIWILAAITVGLVIGLVAGGFIGFFIGVLK